MRKQFASLFALALILTVLPITRIGAEPQKGDATFQTAVLTELGILDAGQNPDAVISRGDWAVLLYRLHQKERDKKEPEAGVQCFDDVERYHYLSGYLAYLQQEGIIHGDGTRAFRPEDAIFGTDLYQTLMCMLGYQRYMQETEPYAIRVQRAVSMSRLSPALMGKNEITYRDAVPVLYELLFCNMMQRDLTDTTQIRHEAGEEYIRSRMGLDYVEGTLEGAGAVSLTGFSGGSNEIVIDQKAYAYQKDVKTAEAFLGYRVLSFLNEEGEIIALCRYPAKQITLLSEDILGYEHQAYSVLEGKRERRIRLDDECFVMYNGCPEENANMQPAFGEVVLVDKNEDGYYDAAFVYEKEIICIREKSAEEGMLYARSADGQVKHISLEQYQRLQVLEDGEPISLNAIPADAVALLCESADGSYLQIEILSDTISGTLESEGEELIMVSGMQYPKATRMMREGIFGIRSEVLLSLDRYGRVVYTKTAGNVQWQYGYVISAWEDDAEEYVGIELLDAMGSIRKIHCAEKVTIDGERYTSMSEIYPSVKTEAIVRFVQKGEVITKLDYADACYFGRKKAVTENNKLLKRLHGSSLLGPSQTFKLYSDQFMPGEAMPSPGAVIFTVNVKEENKAERYGITTVPAMPTDTHYWIEGYNTDPDSIFTDVILVHDYDGSVKHGLPLFLVDSVHTIYDEATEDVAYEVEGLYNGAMIRYRLKDEQLIYIHETTKLSRGDAIYITGLDTKGRITGYSLLYSHHNRKYSEAIENAFSNNSTYFSDYKRIFYGNPVRLEGDALQVQAMYGINYTEVFRLTNIPVYVYEAKTNRIRIGIKEEAAPSDIAVVKTSYSIPQTVVLYKN